jgi:hypothetical protein
LFPVRCGRGIAGAGMNGLLPPGRGMAGAAGVSPSSVVAGTTGAGGLPPALAASSADGMSGKSTCAAERARDAGFLAGAGATSCFVKPSAVNASRSLRATGGSIVDADDLTNSPSVPSFSMTCLLSMPNSAAISCTRGFPATILLSEAYPEQGTPLLR